MLSFVVVVVVVVVFFFFFFNSLPSPTFDFVFPFYWIRFLFKLF